MGAIFVDFWEHCKFLEEEDVLYGVLIKGIVDGFGDVLAIWVIRLHFLSNNVGKRSFFILEL